MASLRPRSGPLTALPRALHPRGAAPFGTQVTERLVDKASGASRYARARCRTGVWRSPAPRANEGVRPLRGLSSRDVASPSEPAARGPRIPSGRSIGLRSDSPRSGRLLSLARGAGERQTPVRGVRSADRSRNTLDSGRSSTCVPNVARSGGAGRAAAGKGAPHRRPVASVRGQLALGRALPESRP